MNIIFICPSNTRFMPYISYYENEIDYNINKKYIIWDRFSSEEKSLEKLIYRDGLYGHQRGLLSYLKYMSFLYLRLLNLKSGKTKIVIFGFQTTFFLVPYLLITKNKYVIDIRDYHYLFKIIPGFVFKKADFIVVSSPAYSKLFNIGVNCMVCHNLYEYDNILEYSPKSFDRPINISYMGAIRDFSSQKNLIDSLSNNPDFLIYFHGVGDIVPNLKKYVSDKGITNVIFTNSYNKEDEHELYEKADIINMLRDDKSYNNRVALPNRLYSAAFFYKPSFCYEGSALADIIREYSLGLCVSYEDCLEDSLSSYFDSFSYTDFKENCDRFLKFIEEDQNYFKECLTKFMNN